MDSTKLDTEQIDGPALSPPQSHAAATPSVASGCDTLHRIAENSITLLQTLPHSAHFRAPLVAHLLRGLPAESAAQIASIAPRTVYAARERFAAAELGELAAQYPAGVKRHVVGDEELSSIRALIRENMLQSGGSLRHLLTNEHIFQRYITDYTQSLSSLVEQHRAHANALSLGPPEPAMETLRRKFDEHATQLAFLAFARSTMSDAASAALAAGHQPGPVDTILAFLEQPSGALPRHRSRGVFDQVLHDISVVRPKKDWGQWDCRHCAKGGSDKAELQRLAQLPLPLSTAQSEAIDKAERAVRTFEDHCDVVHAQCEAVDQALVDADPSHLVVTWDFAQLDAQPNVGDRNNNSPFHILILVLQRGGSERKVYIDFFVQDRSAHKPDVFFVREALLYLRDKTPFFSTTSLVTFISDTCAGEFRSRHAFGQMAAFQERCGFRVRLLFKAPCHGKGIADAHKGHLSRMIVRHLKQQTLARQQLPAAASQMLSPFPDAESLALFLRSSFHTVEYHAFVLPTVDRNPVLKADVRRVPGTMTFHEVTFDSACVMRVKHLSTDQKADIINLHFRRPFSIDGEVACRCCSVACVYWVGWLSSGGEASCPASAAISAAASGSHSGVGHREKPAGAPKHSQAKRKCEDDNDSFLEGGKRPRKERKQAVEYSLPSSDLVFSDLQKLKHVVVAHRVAEEPEVDLWHADIVGINEGGQTVDVRIREWRLLIHDVQPNRVFKASASLPAV